MLTVDDQVLGALADPIRRSILERLVAGGPQTTGLLLENLGVTRQGASRHLKVLEDAGLVLSEKRGREVVRTFNPLPLRGSAEWMKALESRWDEALGRLKQSYEN